MNTSEEKRAEALVLLDNNLKYLYAAPESGEKFFSIFQKNKLTEEQYNKYILAIGDCILGFYKTTDLPRLFQSELGMSADEAQRLLSELIEFLSPVIRREEEESHIKREDIAKLAKTFEASKNQPAEIVPEGKPSDVVPLRTMEGDISRVHGYGAYNQLREAGELDESALVKHEPTQSPTEQAEKTFSSTSQADLLAAKAPVKNFPLPAAPKTATVPEIPIIPLQPIPQNSDQGEDKIPMTSGQIPIRKVE